MCMKEPGASLLNLEPLEPGRSAAEPPPDGLDDTYGVCILVFGWLGGLPFNWDKSNAAPVARHNVTPEEVEQVFANDPMDLGAEVGGRGTVHKCGSPGPDSATSASDSKTSAARTGVIETAVVDAIRDAEFDRACGGKCAGCV